MTSCSILKRKLRVVKTIKIKALDLTTLVYSEYCYCKEIWFNSLTGMYIHLKTVVYHEKETVFFLPVVNVLYERFNVMQD